MTTKATQVIASLFFLTAISLACPNEASAEIHRIDIGNFFFSPTKTEVNPGDTVRWTLVGGVHTTTSEVSSPKSWNSGIIPVSDSFDVVFTVADGPGPFPYLCSVHPLTMKDTIFVASQSFICGDANKDESINVADAVYLINFVFKNGAPPDPLEAGDANCDGQVNVADAVYLINFVFKNGAEPCATCP